MLLTVDIGNTETVLGLFEGRELRRHWRLSTHRDRTGDERTLKLRALLAPAVEAGLGIERAVIASVVPVVDRSWSEAFTSLEIPVEWIRTTTPLPIRVDVEEPATVGADRLVNTLATMKLFGRNTVVVDLGTATTFDCITADGTFLGGVIAPGPRAGIDRLTAQAAQLPPVDIRQPSRVIGRRTVTCLESGVFYSIVGGIDGVVDRILAEWKPDDPLVIATGGLAPLIAPACRTVERVEPFLTLHGLVLADEQLREDSA